MNWLAIDTSMNACGAGVLRADGAFFSRTDAMERGQAEQLMPIILDVLGQAKLTLRDVGALAVTNGPGTFTGLRVGLATARALAQVSGNPAIGVGTFDVLGDEVAGQGDACILIETKRADYYVRLPGGHDSCMSADELAKVIQPHWILVGDAVGRAKQELNCVNKTHEVISPRLDLVIARAQKNKVSGLPEPVYLRGADVSIARRKPAKII